MMTIALLMLAASAFQPALLQLTPTSFLSAGTNVWFPIFVLIVAMVLSILAVIYAMAPLMGRNDIRAWARVKIYELLLTLVIGVAFLVYSSGVYIINPTGIYNGLGLLPTTCASGINGPPPNNLYSLALCDMYQFNQDMASFTDQIFWFSLIGGLSPTVTFHLLAPGYAGGPQTGPEGFSTGVGFTLSVQILPIIFVHQYVVPLMNTYFAMVILAEMQQVLLSASMILFSTLLIMGLVARAFSITKTFGGAMIAFALGFGLIYPLLVSISYGFLDVVIQNASLNLPATLATLLTSLLGALPSFLFNSSANCPPGTNSPTCQYQAIPGFTGLLLYGGFVSAGLVLIPLLNLVIVDAFIVDTSRVIGERMDLMSLLTRLV